MLTASTTGRHGDGGRLFGCFLLSIAVNLGAWVTAALIANRLPARSPHEQIAVVATRIRIERTVPAPLPKPTVAAIPPKARPTSAPAVPVQPPMLPTIALPSNWKTTYMGSARVNDRDIKLWVDWSSQSAEFVPRVFLWHRAVDALDPREVSLRDAVNGILAQLKNEGSVKFYANRPERVCGGRYPGWFLSYDKLDGDPKIHIDDMLLLANNNVYRATYVRTLDEPENRKTRVALRSLC